MTFYCPHRELLTRLEVKLPMRPLPLMLQATRVLAFVMISTILSSCVSRPPSALPVEQPPRSKTPALEMQALVMDMADSYIASLGESIYLLAQGETLDSKGRTLAQSFLRNGVGASLDIAVGPNPPVSLLDLLVLTSLQTWSFEHHWIPGGIGAAGLPALERLKQAENEIWSTAGTILTRQQLDTIRALIDAWIAENSERTVVALVRFNEFADERRISSVSLRREASGLLHEVSEASAAVDEARLLGERLLWYASRYPYLLGEQAELTAYRLLDQPEGQHMADAIKSAGQLGETLTQRLATLREDLQEQQKVFFASLATERQRAMQQFFEQFGQERTRVLDEISAREAELLGLMKELRQTIIESGALAEDLTGTVNAIDQVLSHFDQDPNSQEEPLRMLDIRDAALETGRAAQRLTVMLEEANRILESNAWNETVTAVTAPADALVDRIFWRGVILVGLLLSGLLILRLVPIRTLRTGSDATGKTDTG